MIDFDRLTAAREQVAAREAQQLSEDAKVLARAIADETEARTPDGRREAGHRAINDAIHSQHARHDRRSAAGLERLFGWKPKGDWDLLPPPHPSPAPQRVLHLLPERGL